MLYINMTIQPTYLYYVDDNCARKSSRNSDSKLFSKLHVIYHIDNYSYLKNSIPAQFHLQPLFQMHAFSLIVSYTCICALWLNRGGKIWTLSIGHTRSYFIYTVISVLLLAFISIIRVFNKKNGDIILYLILNCKALLECHMNQNTVM